MGPFHHECDGKGSPAVNVNQEDFEKGGWVSALSTLRVAHKAKMTASEMVLHIILFLGKLLDATLHVL